MDTKLEKRNRLIEVFAQFSEDDQEIIIKALKKQLLLAEAARLSATIQPNSISEDEILDEVKKVRKEMYNAARRSS